MKFSDMGGSKNNSNIMMIVVIVGAMFVGLIVFGISSLFVSKPEKTSNNKVSTKEENKTELELDDDKVTNLYKYVTYGSDNIFVRVPNLKLENFSNYDKFYYSSSLIKEDDIEIEEDKESGNKLHTISSSKIKTYMEKYFGSSVNFEQNAIVTVMLPFDIDGKNICNLTYNNNLTAYTVSCDEKKVLRANNYRELISAKEDGDRIVLKEKVLFIDYKEENDRIDYEVFKDYNHTISITSDDKQLSDFNIKAIFKENKKQLTTITYTFKKKKKNYYFYSSKFND